MHIREPRDPLLQVRISVCPVPMQVELNGLGLQSSAHTVGTSRGPGVPGTIKHKTGVTSSLSHWINIKPYTEQSTHLLF